MTTPASVIGGLNPVTVPDAGGDVDTQFFQLWTVPNAEPARIEAVSLACTFDPSMEWSTVLEIAYVDQSGLVIDRQPTPNFFDQQPLGGAFCTWKRGGTGSEQLPMFGIDLLIVTGAKQGWCSMPLSDVVLPALAVVRLGVYRAADGPPPAFEISDVSLAWTRDGSGDTETVTIADLVPILSPIPLDEQG